MVRFSVDHPKTVAIAAVVLTIGLGAFMPLIQVDTDPENMLSEKEAVRVFHNEMKRELTLHDMVVLGVVNEEAADGVFNPESLRKIHQLARYAETLQSPDPDAPATENGVIGIDLLAWL